MLCKESWNVQPDFGVRCCMSSKLRSLNLATIDILDCLIICHGGCPVCSLLNVYPWPLPTVCQHQSLLS